MKIDIDYLKKLLEEFELSDKPYIIINNLQNKKLDYNSNEFIYHIKLLEDKNLINDFSGNNDVGLSYISNGLPSWQLKMLRLTSEGHDFFAALNEKTIFNKLKNEMKKHSLSAIMMTAKILFSEIINNQINK